VTDPRPLLPTSRVADLDEIGGPTPWLVRSLWSEQAVGFLAGTPKSCKSWLGLDLAISIASATPCLERFEVEQPGPTLVFLAEDSLHQVRRRIAGICSHRRLDLRALDLHVVTAPSLLLDAPNDLARLDATLEQLKPRLVLLDPLVRLHRLDENSSADVSALLGKLRHLQRKHAAAIAVVHHVGKRSRAQLGQALRGSTDLHAWSDSSAYLVRKHDHLELTLEHRSSEAPEPFPLELATDDDGNAFLRVCADDADSSDLPPTPLVELVRRRLADADQPLSRVALRRELRVNNQRLGDALLRLEREGVVRRSSDGWISCPQTRSSSTANQQATRQLSLPGS
jgi:hypothetical protein